MIVPSVGSSSFSKSLISVDFPEPLSPTMNTNSPSSMSRLTSFNAGLLEDVWDTYGDNTGNALEALTHRELPWMEARRGYEPDERCTVVISPITMASYYKSIYVGD